MHTPQHQPAHDGDSPIQNQKNRPPYVTGGFSTLSASGKLIGTIKVIIRIIHTISTEHGFQTPLIKGFVMRNQRKPLYFRSNLLPYFRKNRSMGSIFLCQSMNTGVPIQIVIRFGMNEAVEPVGYLTISHNNHPYTTYAGTFIICRLEVYCCKLSILFFVTQTKVRQKSDIQNSFSGTIPYL